MTTQQQDQPPRPIPLFIQTPCAQSVKDALEELERSGLYLIHLQDFNLETMSLLMAARPCIALFSVVDSQSSGTAFDFLDRLRRLYMARGVANRDPTLRTVLVTQDWTIPLEKWQKAGFHEFIPAPIAVKSLLFKLSRHHLKALAGQAPDDEGPGPVDPFAPDNEVILVKSNETDADGHTREVFFIPGGLGGGATENLERTLVFAAGPVLGSGEKAWTLSPDPTGLEERWVLKHRPDRNGPELTVTFRGEEPLYDTARARWMFRGRNPELLVAREGRPAEKVIETRSDHKVLFSPQAGIQVFEVKTQVAASTEHIGGADLTLKTQSQTGHEDYTHQAETVKQIADYLDGWKPVESSAEKTEGREINQRPSNSQENRTPGYTSKTGAVDRISGEYSGPGERKTESTLIDAQGPSHQSSTPTSDMSGSAPDRSGRLYEGKSEVEHRNYREHEVKADGKAETGPGAQPTVTENISNDPYRKLGHAGGESAPQGDLREQNQTKAKPLEEYQNLSHGLGHLSEKPEKSATDKPPETSGGHAARLPFIDDEDLGESHATARVGEDSPADDGTAITQANEQNDESAARKIEIETEQARRKRFESEAHDPRGAKHFAGQAQEREAARVFEKEEASGSKTWSMQSDDDPMAIGSGKKKNAPAEHAATDESASESAQGKEASHISADPRTRTAAVPQTTIALAGSTDPTKPERPRTWLERLRLFLSRLFD